MKFSFFKDTSVDSELEKYVVKSDEEIAEEKAAEEKAAEQPKPENQFSAIAALTGQKDAGDDVPADDKTIEYKATFNLDDEEEEITREEKTVISEPTEEIEIDEEDDDDEEYEYVTPHYFRNAVLLALLFMVIGMAASFFLFHDRMAADLREAYIANGYIMTNEADATATDIREGKTAYVHGRLITGTYNDIDTSNATATPEDILEGYSAYVDGKLIHGNIPTWDGKAQILPGTKDIIIPKGYYLKDTLTIRGDGNLQAKNIRYGVEIFGVVGSYTGN
ncbi:MAG: hypothetical protein IJM79_01095 [Erysipelotrichaceae bacterium]|nr:hypothetical protein [Erysipelotrichaceae bacterium]